MSIDNNPIHLRYELDILLERFRSETLIPEAPELIADIREQLKSEFVEIISQYPLSTLQKAVLLTYDESLRLPIHLACDKNAPIEILKCFLDADTEKISIRKKDKWGDLPLHTACSRHQTEVVKLLVESDATQETLHTKADNGSLPLHTAIRYKAPVNIIHLLIDKNESTLLEPGPYNQLPLHLACRNTVTADVMQLLLSCDVTKSAVMTGDEVDRLPIHLAFLHNREKNLQLEMVCILFNAMLCGRMELRGLDLWKSDMKKLLELMHTHERDFTTRDKLDIAMDVIRNFMERVHALELAVWRASCLQFNTELSSMQQIIEQLTSSTISSEVPFDICAYKTDRRIKSGADIIVRDVIPFLEYETVDELMSKLREY